MTSTSTFCDYVHVHVDDHEDPVCCRPPRKRAGLGFEWHAFPGLRFAPPWAIGCRPPRQRAGLGFE